VAYMRPEWCPRNGHVLEVSRAPCGHAYNRLPFCHLAASGLVLHGKWPITHRATSENKRPLFWPSQTINSEKNPRGRVVMVMNGRWARFGGQCVGCCQWADFQRLNNTKLNLKFNQPRAPFSIPFLSSLPHLPPAYLPPNARISRRLCVHQQSWLQR
jgi:hypothetical protein